MSIPTKKTSLKSKKLKKSLPLIERVKAINMYQSLRSTRKIAEIFKCSASQIKYILQRKELYLEEWKSKSREQLSQNEAKISSNIYLDKTNRKSYQKTNKKGFPLTEDFMSIPNIKTEPVENHVDPTFSIERKECNQPLLGETLKIDVNTYEEAYTLLGHLERFALDQEDIDGLSIVNALENYFMAKMQESSL